MAAGSSVLTGTNALPVPLMLLESRKGYSERIERLFDECFGRRVTGHLSAYGAGIEARRHPLCLLQIQEV